jgi:hypothetical protein
MMIQFIIGGILIAAGILVSLIIPMKLKNKNLEIKFMQTTPIAELKGILSDNAAAGLSGYRHFVELKGSAGAESEQKAPFSAKNVAYFNADLFQVYEETETTRDDKGVAHQHLVRHESLLTNQKSSGIITIQDAQSGEKVYFDIAQSGLQLDTLKTLDKFESADSMRQYNFFGSLKYSLLGAKTLGFRMVENTIPLGQALYAMGDTWLENAKIYMGKPIDEKKPFILSVRSETDIVQSNKTGATVALVFGILLAIAGILIMIFVH